MNKDMPLLLPHQPLLAVSSLAQNKLKLSVNDRFR